MLRPPVEPMLAQAAEVVPPVRPLASGVAYEQKFDGYRALLFTPTDAGGRLLVQTRRGTLIQDRFPDLVAAGEQLPAGLVLDGELVVWDKAAGRLSFEGLQRRTAARGRTARELAASLPPTSSPSTSSRQTASRCYAIRIGSATCDSKRCFPPTGSRRRGRCAR
ncbi:hypothetical protein ACIA6C_29925 [Streptomyces sp. NPDC051578]|uniref:ATP-dependent DNA ligase n=1 Tax=Streptomyces sp. NPDC051578 TaxID=3365662 RepID=UPI0037A35E32